MLLSGLCCWVSSVVEWVCLLDGLCCWVSSVVEWAVVLGEQCCSESGGFAADPGWRGSC